MKITSFTRLYLLTLLASSPRHGYELIKELGHNLGKTVSASEIYPFLKELKKLGYVEVQSEGNREMKKYILTTNGKKFTKEILDNLSSIFDALITSKVVSCAHCSCKIYGSGHVVPKEGKETHFCCKYCAEAKVIK
ncbi:PadR family transcriptional regulator [Candidatus Micrarchaeota archaeon]|nr:PadR family transcriptional regulator [Candidatus Micrarchaeota archaeon]